MAATNALSGTREESNNKRSPQNTTIDRILECAVALNWDALAKTNEAIALQVEYHIGSGGSLEDRHAASYQRIARQCADARRQVERQTISIKVAGEVTRLVRLLLGSVDLHCQPELSRSRKASRAIDQRTGAQNALRRLRNAIRKSSESSVSNDRSAYGRVKGVS